MPLELTGTGRGIGTHTGSRPKPTAGWELMFPPLVSCLRISLQLLLTPLLLQRWTTFFLQVPKSAPSLKSTLWLLELSFRSLLLLLLGS